MFDRALNLDPAQWQSCFLWGPRQTGKSTLLRQRFPDAPYYDLLRANSSAAAATCQLWNDELTVT